MCAIGGYYSRRFTARGLAAMNEVMRHRGPDAAGVFTEKEVGLAHRRLSIIDLSDAANQPMESANGEVVMVYNGEIYNYRQLGKSYRCRTRSDSEVLLEHFAAKGPAAFDDLNGMFGAAFYQRRSRRLTLVRDRVGIKPLYYYWDGVNLAFASELKGLTALLQGQIELEIDPQAISAFLYLGFIPHPHSIYKNIYKLPPGHYLTCTDGEIRVNSYWRINDTIAQVPLADAQAAEDQLDALLQASVRRRLISDVPVGTFLSGGIDSSVVTAVATRFSDERVRTFSVGFDDKAFDESRHSREIASHLGTLHTEIILDEEQALEQFHGLMDIYDEPFADSSALPTLLVSQLASKDVKVVLSGDGGDELFHGYGRYNWARRIAHPLVRPGRAAIRALLAMGPGPRFRRAARLFDAVPASRLRSHIYSQEAGAFSQPEIRQLLRGPSEVPALQDVGAGMARTLDAVEEQAMFDFVYYLRDDNLTKLDRASMFHSIEARVPLLDHELVEFAQNVHRDLKTHSGVAKHLLKQVLYRYAPPALFDRPKQGFSVPMARWLRGELRSLVDRTLSEESVAECGVVHYASVARLLDRFRRGEHYLFNRIYLLLTLHQWLVKHRTQVNSH